MTSNQIGRLVDGLQNVKKTGRGRWIACCPAHPDKSPSLAIRELDDGRILIHCHAGCSTESILSALEMTFADLMPESRGHHIKSERRPFSALEVLRCLRFEGLVMLVAAKTLSKGEPLDESDRERLLVALERLQSGLTIAEGAL